MPIRPHTDHQFKPGHAPNPNGSSRKVRLREALCELILERKAEKSLAIVGLTEALKGDFHFWSTIYEMLDPAEKAAAGSLIDLVAEAELRAQRLQQQRKRKLKKSCKPPKSGRKKD